MNTRSTSRTICPAWAYGTAPNPAWARRVARESVEKRIAACVHILPPARTVYRWNGKIETSTETPMIFKIRASGFPRLARLFRQRHPYECPGLVVLPIADGLPDYLAWMASETATKTH
jgi:periplasmic divalent cation tolerance protein